MKHELTNHELPEVDETLVALVDSYLEDQLDAEQLQELEQRLESEVTARAYLADRIQLHAELETILQPMRVEMLQKRQIIFDYKHGLPHISTRQSHVVRVGNPDTEKFLELPPTSGRIQIHRAYWITLAVLLVALTVAIYWILQRNDEQPTVVDLTLRNPGFENTDLSQDKDAFSYILLDWQDHFMTKKAGICTLANYSKQSYKAHSGDNVAILKPIEGQVRGYLTQRLLYTDGTPLKAELGLHLRIHGWALVEQPDQTLPLRVALRVVKGGRPEMWQYEPCFQSSDITGGKWQPFTVDLILPEDSLEFSQSHGKFDPVTSHAKSDLKGSPLTLNIENLNQDIIYIDDLRIEVMP